MWCSVIFLLGLFPGHGTGHRKVGRGPVRNNINMLCFLDLVIFLEQHTLPSCIARPFSVGICREENDEKERYNIFKYFL